MKTRKDSTSKPTPISSACNIEIPFSGIAVYRVQRKLTMATLIRVLLGLAVFLTFLGNILFILETREMNIEGEKQLVDYENDRQRLPRPRDVTGSNIEKKNIPSKSCDLFSSLAHLFFTHRGFFIICRRFYCSNLIYATY